MYASPWGSVSVDPRAIHFMHSFWGMLGHIVNLFVFMVAGARIVLRVKSEGQSTEYEVRGKK